VSTIRTAAKAIIVRDGRLLLNRCRDATGEWFALPGGGQEVGESLPETLVRECREEIDAEVEVLGLLFVRDYIVAHHDFSYLDEAEHQVEFLFECRVPADYRPRSGSGPDRHQEGVAWLGHEELQRVRVYPSGLRDWLDPSRSEPLPHYWGDVN
jgi:ADP-ribose pyrophosphatase YjhB (NUDIX family)